MSVSKQIPVGKSYEIHDVVSDASYNYYLAIDRKGQILVTRVNLSNTEVRYAVGTIANYTIILANIDGLNYKKINEFGG